LYCSWWLRGCGGIVYGVPDCGCGPLWSLTGKGDLDLFFFPTSNLQPPTSNLQPPPYNTILQHLSSTLLYLPPLQITAALVAALGRPIRPLGPLPPSLPDFFFLSGPISQSIPSIRTTQGATIEQSFLRPNPRSSITAHIHPLFTLFDRTPRILSLHPHGVFIHFMPPAW
jgi:hypothetical protein